MQTQTTNRRWASLILGCVVMAFLGLIYAWSIFVAPLESEFQWNRAQTSFTFTMSIIFFIIGLISSGPISGKLGKRGAMLISAACAFIGFALCSRISSLTQLYIFYGVFVGFGVGVANNALVSSIVKWFPEKTGLASGVLMMGFGLGSMLMGPLAVQLMADIGWRSTFFYMSIAFAAILALGSFLVKLPPENSATAQSGGAESQDMSIKQVLSSSSYWMYFFWFVLVMAGGLLILGHASPYAQDLGATASQAAVAAGVLSLCNGLGRILCGLAYDKFGLKTSMRLTTGYLILAAVLLIASTLTSSMALMYAGFIFTGLSYGGGPTTSSTFAGSFYGMKHFSENYGAVSAGMAPGALLGPYLAGVLRTSGNGYLSSLVCMLVFGAVAMCVLNLIKKPEA